MKRVCAYCGANPGRDGMYVEAARAFGRQLVANGQGLVYGGGSTGLMGTVADAVLEAGGEAIGVIPAALQSRELGHTGLSELHVVDTMHERKALMAELSDGFVAMPGGMGTLEELSETLTWAQLGIHPKPCGLLDVGGYWQPLVALFDEMVDQGFLKPLHRGLLLSHAEAGPLLAAMDGWRPPNELEAWAGSAGI
jgi:uncharacterized protein (TIGR00730 family)